MRQSSYRGKTTGAIAALSLGALLLVACAHQGVGAGTRGSSSLNQTVTVKGEVDHPLGPGVFVLDSEELPNEDTLVVFPTNEGPASLQEGDDVSITGSLQSMSLTELQQRYKITLPEKVMRRFDGKPVFLAQRIDVTDR